MIGPIQTVHDPEDPRLEVYRSQKDAWLRARHNPDAGAGATGTGMDHGLFMAEGSLVVEHLLDAPFPIDSVLVAEHRAESLSDLLCRVPESVPILGVSRELAESIIGFNLHRGLLACAHRLPDPDPVELASSSRALVILEDLANHDNVGSVFRSVAALGGHGVSVLLSPRCCDPLYRKALRVSMGHAMRVPFATVEDWPNGLAAIRDLGFELVAMDPDSASEPIEGIGQLSRPALVLGAEGPGLTGPVRDLIGRSVRIPMASGADSLNIAVAAAVAMNRIILPEDAPRRPSPE